MQNTPGEQQRNGSLQVERCIVELQRGREIAIQAAEETRVVAAVETIDNSTLDNFSDLNGEWRLLLTPQRCAALGIADENGPQRLHVSTDEKCGGLAVLAGLERATRSAAPAFIASESADTLDAAALLLARQARLLPALLVREADDIAAVDRLLVSSDDVQAYPEDKARRLRRISAAHVPLANHDECEFIVFREEYGELEHVAIVVGQPDRGQAIPVRLHSACLTGDLLGSLRCDCGEQLRGAVSRLAAAGGGVLLYLAQEGRGIGLANKLRAYALQDTGLDTVEADRYLGFHGDERVFSVACVMLKQLHMTRIRLLTNNPHKINALRAGGIDVVERIALPVTVNPHNARYIHTKHQRAGHYSAINSTSDCQEADILP